MPIEIERKFLVRADSWRSQVSRHQRIQQGYLAKDRGTTVRVRREGERHVLAVKAARAAGGRWEWEFDISAADGEAMLGEACPRPPIDKTRYYLPQGELTWELDVFHGANAGLLIAELELPALDTPFHRPEWLGPEVSDDSRFINAQLYEQPFGTWGIDYAELLASLGA